VSTEQRVLPRFRIATNGIGAVIAAFAAATAVSLMLAAVVVLIASVAPA
jgi:hypothetical protein